MEEIEVGEYVRTKNNGIKRIDTIFENKTVNKYGYEIGSDWEGTEYSIIKTTDILKHSRNIIDLIEVNDYVNGYKITDIISSYLYTEVLNLNGDYKTICDYQIKSIVTHEQFNQAEYRVKE